jgi:hypothetical protein
VGELMVAAWGWSDGPPGHPAFGLYQARQVAAPSCMDRAIAAAHTSHNGYTRDLALMPLALASQCHALLHGLAYNQMPLKKMVAWIVSFHQTLQIVGKMAPQFNCS